MSHLGRVVPDDNSGSQWGVVWSANRYPETDYCTSTPAPHPSPSWSSSVAVLAVKRPRFKPHCCCPDRAHNGT